MTRESSGLVSLSSTLPGRMAGSEPAMAKPPSPVLDERLAQLGREWFAEVSEKDRTETKTARSPRDPDTTSDAGADLLDWVFGDSDASDGGWSR